ncbi:hypothetical protein [His2 virus]|uniref:Uncharacterized protein n=1 Tax=His 2 virus TaxID=128710 RepID=Q25BC9_HIS2V|nr:hypothetical protein His2V_gp31 [His2 virus]AAQ13811.1 hypothetical protein [His2 virus]
MKDKIDQKTENGKKAAESQMQDIRTEMQNLRSDIQDVKGTWEDDKPNAKRKTRYVLSEHKTKIAGLVALLIPAWFVLDLEIPTIPESAIVVGLGVTLGIVVGYIPAKYVVDKFVKDTRKPIFEIDAEKPNDVALYYVPEERIPDIEVYEGDKNDISTKKGIGYEFEKFEQVEYEGEQYLIGKGTWVGEKSGLELKRNIGNIHGMKKTMKPYAQLGFAYEVMWPHIMRELESSVGNKMARTFEGVGVYNGEEMRDELDQLIEEYNPDNIMDTIDKEDIEEKANGHSDEEIEQILN